MALSPKHRAFVDNYFLHHLSMVQAYMATYPNASRESAYRDGSRLMRNDEIAAAIEKKLSGHRLSADRVLALLAEHAHANIEHFLVVDDDGFAHFDLTLESAKDHLQMIKHMKTSRTRRMLGRGDNAEPWEDEKVEIELHDAQAALEKLGRFHKLFGDMQITGTLSLDVEEFEKALDKVYGPKEGAKTNGNGKRNGNGNHNGKKPTK